MALTALHILESAPQRFRPEKAQEVTAIFHFIISGDEDFSITLEIENSVCRLCHDLIGEATCVVKTSAQTYIELESGKINPQSALMSGKIKVSNITAMLQFSKCFQKFDEALLQQEQREEQAEEALPTSKNRSKIPGPLRGVKIIDFTRLLPGPMATMLLADMGADVIKVEDPDSPDYVRSFEPMIDGISVFYYALNRNKRSLGINYLSDEGREVINALVREADVLIEQFRPGVMKKFGLDYDTLKAINPKLIYISITGYGQDSSLALAAGHDVNYLAIAGLLGITGTAEGGPVIPGFQAADVAGGSYMAMNAVTAALYQRERTGAGQYIDLSITDCMLPFMALPFAEYQAIGKRQGIGQFQLSGGQANYNIYKCGDGKYIALGSLEPKFWDKICLKLNHPEWRERIINDAEGHKQIRQELQEIFQTKTRDEWCLFFADSDACISPINELDEIADDPHLNERKLFTSFQVGDKMIKTIAQPVRFAGNTHIENWIAPQLGEDTVAILREMNWSDERIKELIHAKIIKTI